MAGQRQTQWDSVFSRSHYHYGTNPNRWIEFAVERYVGPVAGDQTRAFDLAAGEGRNSAFLATRGYAVTAYDSSAVGLEKARRLFAELRETADGGITGTVTTRVRDVLDVADAQVNRAVQADLVVSSFFHVPHPDRHRMFAAHAAFTRPGGLVIAEWFHPDQRTLGKTSGGPPRPEQMVRPADLELAFAGWRFLACHRAERVLAEGPGHVGEAVVTQLAAIKPDA